MKRLVLATLLLTFVLVGAWPASASPLVLSCPGGLTSAPAATPAITFNPLNINSGIPTTAVCAAVFNLGSDVVTIAGSITQRFSNPAPTNNGVATYTVQAVPDTANSSLMNWQFDYYGSVVGTGSYWFRVFYDLDPAAGTDQAALGTLNGVTRGTGSFQDSQNLCFGFLSSGVPGVVTPPVPLTPCNPNLAGNYSFGIQYGLVGSSTASGYVAWEVNAASVPEPASLLLLGSGLFGVVTMVRRRKAKK